MNINNKCVAHTRGNGCKILTVKKCIGESCPFAKTKEQIEASCEKSFKRLASIDKELQRYIAEKYYGGKMPWKKGGDK